MWTRLSNVFFLLVGWTWLATPGGAVFIVDPSCKDVRSQLDQTILDAQAVVDKAYRRLLAIKKGDTKAEAMYKTLFGKDSDPEARIDETKWRDYQFQREPFEPKDFIHPGRVVDVFDRMRHISKNPFPIRIDCGQPETCDKGYVGQVENPSGPREDGAIMVICKETFAGRSDLDLRPAVVIAREGLKRAGSLDRVAWLTRTMISLWGRVIPVGGAISMAWVGYWGQRSLPASIPFLFDWARDFEACYNLAQHPNPLQPYRQPVSNDDTYALLAIALYLDGYDWIRGQVDTATSKPLPMRSWWQKQDENIRGAFVGLARNPLTGSVIAGTDQLSPQYTRAHEFYMRSQNPNYRRWARGEWAGELVQRFKMTRKAADCLSERMIPLEKPPTLWLLDPKVKEWWKFCGAPPEEPCRSIPSKYCQGKSSSTTIPVEKGKEPSSNGITSGQVVKRPQNGLLIASDSPGDQPREGILAPDPAVMRSQKGILPSDPSTQGKPMQPS
ncbi:MAG: hypothetical protein M1823_000431 [Watsoniomyces obsoletus]|nr:MAG: hypothetical protein M1823_000431 [Watsoniomyces obsoletus]